MALPIVGSGAVQIAASISLSGATVVNANSHSDQTFTLTGAQPNMIFDYQWVSPTTNLIIGNMYCANAGSVVIRFVNSTATNATPAGNVLVEA